MTVHTKSTEELTAEIKLLQQELHSLKILYNSATRESKQNEKDLTTEEEAFRYNNSRFELAVDAIDMAWWDMDVISGNVIFHKRKVEMLGFQPDEFHHYTDFTRLVHPDDYESAMNAMRNHLKGLAPNYEIEYRIRTFSGEYKWTYDLGTVVKRDSKGMPLKVIGFVMDITKRKLMELEIKNKNAELLKINAEKDKFFSIIAHDLRGPLGGLLEITKLMSNESLNLTEDQKNELFTVMSSSASNSFNLLENLLEWSGMLRGQIPFNPQTIQLLDLVNGCMKMFADSAHRKEIGLNTEIPVEIKVKADAHMLQTVIRNLVSNAIKFTRQGGQVSISARLDENKAVMVSVKDSGIGLTSELRNNLFRLDINTKRPGTNGEPSTGLGLQLCKEFIEKHGGEIWVESVIDQGSVFHFTIPSGAIQAN
ncbi:MAG TPA: PAS domain-containing sensor histidine kinase [Prolixibacteraceae bacterium]|jgi:PAS domain S-box-containing protein